MTLVRLALAAVLLLGAGCGTLLPKPVAPPTYHTLEAGRPARETPPAMAPTATLIVGAPQAGAGYDTRRILYQRHAGQLEYFAHAEWVDTPSRMLAPLIVAALEAGGAFRAVVAAPSVATGDLRLDTDIVRLQHDFTVQPSRVRITLRATLLDTATRRVLATHRFEAGNDSASEDAAGGVAAAGRALRELLPELARFCADGAALRVAPR